MIDDATIKRVAMKNGLFTDTLSDRPIVEFARSIEQLARQEQREADARICIHLINTVSDPIVIGHYRADGGTNALTNAAIAIRASGKENSNE